MAIPMRLRARLSSVTILAAIISAVLVIGCGTAKQAIPSAAEQQAPPSDSAQTTQANQTPDQPPARRYSMQGHVVSVLKDQNKIVVQHGDIPGFMNAMTMPYAVKDPQVLNIVKPKDNITAVVVVEDGRFYLENVAVVPPGPTDQANPPAAKPAAPAPAAPQQ